MTISPQEIFHALTYNDSLTQTKPNTMSDVDIWITEARHAIEGSSDLIETLALQLENTRAQHNSALLILDRVLPHLTNTMRHIKGCEQDWQTIGYPHVVWHAGGCKACETLALIQYHLDETTPILNDREINNVIPNANYL